MRLALITIFAIAFVAIAVFFLNAKPAVDPLLLKPAAFHILSQ